MPWQTPKTDWTKKDVTTPSDLNRIEANILELKKASTIDIEDSAGNFEATNVEDALQELAGKVTTGKTMVASAIYSMGQQADGSMTFAELAAKIRDISKDATAAPNDVLSGRTFYQGGLKRTGTMPNRGAVVITPGPTTKPIPAGYHNGEGYVATDPNLVPENIVQGKNIFGVEGTAYLPPFGRYSDLKAIWHLSSSSSQRKQIRLSPDGTYLVLSWAPGAPGSILRFFKRSGDAYVLIQELNSGYPVTDLAWAPNGQYLAGSTETGYVILIKRVSDTFSVVSAVQATSSDSRGVVSAWDTTSTYFIAKWQADNFLMKRTGDSLAKVSTFLSSGFPYNTAYSAMGDANLEYIVVTNGARTASLAKRTGDSVAFLAHNVINYGNYYFMSRDSNYVIGVRGDEVSLWARNGSSFTQIQYINMYAGGDFPDANAANPSMSVTEDGVFPIPHYTSSESVISPLTSVGITPNGKLKEVNRLGDLRLYGSTFGMRDALNASYSLDGNYLGIVLHSQNVLVLKVGELP